MNIASFKDDCPLHSNSILSKRSVLKKDFFNETQKPAFTDLELFVRLLTHKVKFIYTPIVGMYFRRHPKSRTTDQKYTQEAYVGYLELLYERKKELLDHIPHIDSRIRMAFKGGDKSIFYRLLKIYNRPVRLPIGTIKIRNKWGLKFIFFLNLAKMKFLWHYRSKILRLSD